MTYDKVLVIEETQYGYYMTIFTMLMVLLRLHSSKVKVQ